MNTGRWIIPAGIYGNQDGESDIPNAQYDLVSSRPRAGGSRPGDLFRQADDNRADPVITRREKLADGWVKAVQALPVTETWTGD